MLGLATLVVTLLRFRARACVVLACLAAMLCATTNASALELAQTKTRVWDFSSADALNIRPIGSASSEQHPEFSPSQSEHASGSPHAARAAPKFVNPKFAAQLEQQLAKDGSRSIFKSLRSLEGRLAEHEAKLPNLQYKSSVEREIGAFKDQIDTLKQFVEHHGLKP